MLNSAINHVTAANHTYEQLLQLAVVCGCNAVEVRTDLPEALFSGYSAMEAGDIARHHGVTILAIAQIDAFNHVTDETLDCANRLASQAAACGARGVALIPANDGSNPGAAQRKQMLRTSIAKLLPVFEANDICGFIEPLGFSSATLRYKAEAVEVIEQMDVAAHFQLVHDTFHHFLSGEQEYFPQYTAVVHASGVNIAELSPDNMEDHHRVLVDKHDRLGNLDQLTTLLANAYSGSVSIEAFAPEVQALPNLAEKLRDSFSFIHSALAAKVA